MNEYDSNRIYDLVKSLNYFPTNNIDEADCYVLNTCHIREKATDKVYHEVGRIKKRFKYKKKPITIIAGCVAQAEGDILLKKEKYIDAVIGPQSYHEINKVIKNTEKNKINYNATEFNVIKKFDELNLIKNSNSKVSSFLTIQEGCDKFCNFCVVPYTRGPEYSRSFKEILSEANQLVENGSKEIVLLGQNVNAYLSEKKTIADLLFELNNIKHLKRIRYTTSHPKDVTSYLIDAHQKCEKVMPFLHLPVQSGSDKILKNMNRNHTISDYLNIINKFKEKKPSMRFSSDFIIGYPGENETDFDETMSLMKKVRFINSYSFLFSPRPGTPAASKISVDYNLAKKRLQLFQNLSNEIKKDYRNKLIKTRAKVLFENKINGEKDKYFGRDEYSNAVIVKSNEDLIGKIKDIQIIKCNQNTLFGEMIIDFNKEGFAA